MGYATPLWHSRITVGDTKLLESLQKKTLGIILGVTYEDNRRLYKIENKTTNYLGALEKLDLEQLSVRREMLTKKFAVQEINPALMLKPTRMSAIPYMTRTLNDVKQMDSK